MARPPIPRLTPTSPLPPRRVTADRQRDYEHPFARFGVVPTTRALMTPPAALQVSCRWSGRFVCWKRPHRLNRPRWSAADPGVRSVRQEFRQGLGGEAIGVAWVDTAKSSIYQGFLALAVEADAETAPTAPVCAAVTQEIALLQGFCLGHDLATAVGPGLQDAHDTPGIRA